MALTSDTTLGDTTWLWALPNWLVAVLITGWLLKLA
jgi:hypothetical protein